MSLYDSYMRHYVRQVKRREITLLIYKYVVVNKIRKERKFNSIIKSLIFYTF